MRMRCWPLLLVLALPAWLPAGAQADEPEAPAAPAPDDLGCDAVLEAFAAGDAQRLRRLGADRGRDAPDPWEVVDELIAVRELDAARAFAEVVAVDRDALLRYLATPDAVAPFAELRAAFHAAGDEHEAGRPQSALMHVESLEPWSGPPHVLASRMATLRGAVLAGVGRLREAADAHAEATRHAQSLGWISQVMNTLVSTATVSLYAGLYEQALECFDRLLVLQEEREGLLAQAATLADLGTVESSRCNYPRALSRFNEAAQLAFEGGDLPAAAAAHSQRMYMLAHGGRWAQALATRHEAEETLRAARAAAPAPETSRAGGASLDELESEHEVRAAVLDWYVGEHEAALARVARAEKLLEGGKDVVGRGVLVGNRGMFFKALGRFQDAARDYHAALNLFERAPDDLGTPLLIANTQHALAELGVWGARQALRQIEVEVPAGPERDRQRAAVQREGLHRALVRARLAVRTAERHGYFEEGSFRETLSAVLTELGQFDEAERELREARRLLAQVGEVTERMYIETSTVRLLVRRGEPARAVQEARQALDRLAATDAGTRPDSRLRAVTGEPDLYDLAVIAVGRIPDEQDPAQRALQQFEFLEAGRSMSLLDALGGKANAGDAFVPPALRAQRDAARTAKIRANVARQAWRAQALDTPEWRDELRAHKEAYAAADEALQRVEAQVAKFVEADLRNDVLRPAPVLRSELRLATGEALVTYGILGEEAWGTVATRDGIRSVRLAGTPAEVAFIERAADALVGPQGATSAPRLDTERAAAHVHGLRRTLWEPLALPPGVSRVLISPDSKLAYLPWAWIAAPENAVDVALVPSAATFAWLRRDPRGRGAGVVAVGAPDYDAAPMGGMTGAQLESLALRGGPVERGAAGRPPRFRPLPHAATEVERVASHSGDLKLVGAAATEDGVWSALASRGERHRWRAVHFAVHGYVDAENPARAFLALTPSIGEDGLLTVAEVMGRRVPTDLVVLSACSTGRGDFVRGEGLMGLSRAFLFAGAPRVVASLWPVSDAGTARLMTLLYERLDQGLDAARALRQAQAALRAENPDPAGWAAWVLWGLPEGPGQAPASAGR